MTRFEPYIHDDGSTGFLKGFCQCGCGGRTEVATRTEPRLGWVRGERKPFLSYHGNRGSRNPAWKDEESLWDGFCQCGCGKKTGLASQTNRRRGWQKGHPLPFLPGHTASRNPPTGPDHPRWSGGCYIDASGYLRVKAVDHPRATSSGYVLEHHLVAEAALGRHLPDGAVVHHVNGDKGDNDPSNLVVCEDQSYHMLLHYRQRALDECGNADWLRCQICGEWDEPDALYVHECSVRHRACHAEYMANHRPDREAA